MRIECQECLFTGNESAFETSIMVPSEADERTLVEAPAYRCPKCGAQTEDMNLGDGCPLAKFDDKVEISRQDATTALLEHAEAILETEYSVEWLRQTLTDGFKGFNNYTEGELTKEYNDEFCDEVVGDRDEVVVLTDKYYKEKYGE